MMRRIYILLLSSIFAYGVNAQNIGIGTPDPDYTLDINGTVGINDFIYHNNDGGTWMGFPGNDKWEVTLADKQMIFSDGGNKEVIINQNSDDVDFLVISDGIEHLIHANTSANKVGIGKTNPDFLLEVNGEMGIANHIVHAGNANSRFGFPANNLWEVIMNNHQMINADGVSKELIINPGNENVDFIIVADGIEHLMHAETQSYRLGIGTSSPDFLLDVAGEMGIDDFIYHNDDTDTRLGFPSDDLFELNVANKQMIKADGPANELIVNPGTDNVDFIILADGIEHLIHVNTYDKMIGIGTATPAYFVDIEGDFRVIGDAIDHLFFVDASTGRVGIGTNTPTVALDVAGQARVDGLTVGNSSGTNFQAIQTGEYVFTNNSPSGAPLLFTINFPNAFSTATPSVIASPVILSGANNKSFAVTVVSSSATGALLNVNLIQDGTAGWTDDVQINWIAWE